jgi:Asp-tRNA(Asn)/Glu-tRNA(Gln) amidotransferase A subunit family amidase
MVEPHYLGAIELGDQIAAYRISSVEVTQHLIARIEARDAEINAVVVHDFDRALIAAAEADARIAAGDRLPLLGVPMLAKESFDLALVPDLMEQSRVYQHLISAFAGSFMPEPAYQLVAAQAAELDREDESFRAARTRGTVSGHRDWQAVNGRRHALAGQWARLFESFDVVIKPPFPTAAFSHDQVSPKELRADRRRWQLV